MSTALGCSKAKWWLYFLEIISPATSSQTQEVKPILRHSADSQLKASSTGLTHKQPVFNCSHTSGEGMLPTASLFREEQWKRQGNLTTGVAYKSIEINNLSKKSAKSHM